MNQSIEPRCVVCGNTRDYPAHIALDDGRDPNRFGVLHAFWPGRTDGPFNGIIAPYAREMREAIEQFSYALGELEKIGLASVPGIELAACLREMARAFTTLHERASLAADEIERLETAMKERDDEQT